jgi:hypothetical protein
MLSNYLVISPREAFIIDFSHLVTFSVSLYNAVMSESPLAPGKLLLVLYLIGLSVSTNLPVNNICSIHLALTSSSCKHKL